MTSIDGIQGDATAARVAVAIVSYGTSAMVTASMPKLMQELSHLAGHHVVIVDNDSPNGDGLRLEQGIAALDLGPAVEVVRSPVNGGFAAGNNIAFERFRQLPWQPDAILLLNPDAEMHPGALREMLRVMQVAPRAGFVGPRLENPDGSSWVAAFRFPTLTAEVVAGLAIGHIGPLHRFTTVMPDTDTPTAVDWVTGTATLIRRAAWEALGDMDDGYFLYFEEVDYMLQGRRLGWESWHAPAALIGHVAGAATGVKDGRIARGRQPDYWFQSWARYFAKNHGAGYARSAAAAKLLAILLGTVQRRLRGKVDPRPDRFLRDFAGKVVFARLSPPPCSAHAATPGGRPVPDMTPALHPRSA
jgi:GT2 family glycosyltransferase